MAPRMTTQRRVFKGLGNGVLVLMLLWTAIPFYWMIATSLKHDKEIYGYEATLIPERPTLANYATVFRETPYMLFLRNSVVVAVGSTVLSMVIACLGAYAIAMLTFPGRSVCARVHQHHQCPDGDHGPGELHVAGRVLLGAADGLNRHERPAPGAHVSRLPALGGQGVDARRSERIGSTTCRRDARS